VKHRRLRVAVVTGLLVALAGVTWIYLAPVGIGGGTAYVVTHGVSMEPRFHTGDLAIVRAASAYRVGQIVAYHSSLLHEVVLHRIVAIHHGRYVFKGDNNSFFETVDPRSPCGSRVGLVPDAPGSGDRRRRYRSADVRLYQVGRQGQSPSNSWESYASGDADRETS
jgi:signal peptidase I